MIEIWKDIPGYEGIYQCSNKGEVKRLVSNRCVKERILKGVNSRGYLMVTMSKNAIHDRRLVHRIVAELFIPNPLNRPQVNHIDANPSNNCVDNLEWCNQSENIIHAHKMGRMGGIKSGLTKYKEEDILAIRLKYAWGYSFRDLAKEYKRRTAIMKDIVTGISFKDVSSPITYLRSE